MTDKALALLQAVENAPRDVRFTDLLKLMEACGFACKPMTKGGHGVKFRHRVYAAIIVTAARPKGNQRVKICYISDCRKAIYEVQRREDEGYA